MYAILRSPPLVLIGLSFLLAACGDSTGVVDEEETLDFAAATPVGSLAGFLGLDVNARSASPAAVDVFLKIPDIPGESEHPDHRDEIDIQSFSWGTSVSVDRDDSGNTTGLSRLGAIVVRKNVDAASHELTHVAQQNAVLPEVMLSIRADGGTGEAKYFDVTLTDARVASVSTGSAGDAPTEEVTFTFQRVTWTLPGRAPAAGTVRAVTPVDGIVEFLDLDIHAAQPTAAASNFYLKLDNIDGETRAEGHEGEIDLHGIQWGTVLDVDAAARTARVQTIEIGALKAGDTSSAAIAEAARTGEVIAEGVLSVRGGGTSAAPEYFRVTLEDVIISSVTPIGTPGAAPMEQLSLNFERVQW